MLVPVLVLLVLFVLWAGRGGRAALTVDLAAEEAAVVAALCCDERDAEGRERAVESVLASRPGLGFLCVGGPRPLGEKYVSQSSLYFDPDDDPDDPGGGGSYGGVGVLEVEVLCESDGAVAPLRGVFPVVPFVGRATEVVLLAPPLGAVAGVPFLRVSDARAVESEESMTFTLSLDRPARADITVSYQTMAGSAVEQDTVCTSGGDYRRAGGTATIFAGQRGVEVKVEVCNDDIHEMAEETFLLRLSQPFGAMLDRFVATGTIVDDDDAPEVSVEPAPAPVGSRLPAGSALEGDAVQFVVRMSGQSAVAVRVRLETAEVAAGSATAVDDYEVVPTGDVSQSDTSGVWVEFPVGDTDDKTVWVQTLKDERDEPSKEYFEVRLSRPENATVGTGVATGTILDDDDPAVSISDGAGIESGVLGTDTTMTFDVTLERSTTQEVTVNWETRPDERPESPPGTRATQGTKDSGCVGGGDYLGDSGTVTIPVGEREAPVGDRPEVTICGDTDPDDADEETFLVYLLDEPTNATLGDDVGVGTIFAGGDPFVKIDSAEAQESGGPMTFTVELTWVTDHEVTVNVMTEDVTAVAGDDYLGVSRQVTIKSGERTETVEVDLVNDAVEEPEEHFKVELLSGTGHRPRPLQDGDWVGKGTIFDDDDPPTVDVKAARGTEGALLEFEVTLSHSSNEEVIVDFTTGHDATLGAHQATAGSACGPPGVYLDHVDYLPHRQRVTFDVDPITKVTGTVMTIRVESCGDATTPDVGDGIDEYDETFTVTLDIVSGNALEGNLTATGTIEDDDLPPVITVVRADSNTVDNAVVEGDPPAFVATLSRPSSRPIQVTWSTKNRTTGQHWENAIGGARLDYGADYVTNSFHMDFDSGTISNTIYVSSIDDDIDEQRESFQIHLAVPNDYEFATLATDIVTGLIVDDDPTPVVSIVADDADGVTEGGAVGFTVSLDRPSSREVTVNVTTAADPDPTPGAHQATALSHTACPTSPSGDYLELVGHTVTFEVDDSVDAPTGATTPTDPVTTPRTWTQLVEVQSCDDLILEYPETFLAQLANPSDGNTAPAGPLDLATALNDRAVGTIVDDETPQLTILPAHALEGAVVTFEVVLNGLIERELEVTLQAEDYSEDDYQGLARPGDPGDPGDYNPKLRSGSLTAAESLVVTFPADNEDFRKISVSVRTTDDDLHEFNERFALRDHYTLPSFEEPFEAVTFGTIINDDAPPVVVVAPEDPGFAVEGGAMRFTVSLLSDPDDPTSSTGAGRPITVHYATDRRDPVTAPPPIAIGGGACGRPDAPDTPDYVNKATYDHDPDTSDDDPPTLDGVLTFAVDPGTGETYAHQLSRTVEVITCVDDPTEGEETFLLHLANPDEYLDGFDVDVDLDGDDNDEANLADLDGDNTDDVAKALMRGTPATGKIRDGDCATLEGNPPTVTADSPTVSVDEGDDSVELTFTLSPAFCEGVSGALLANTRDGAPGVDPATGEAEGIAAVLDPLEATACVTDVGDYVNVADYVALANSEVTAVGGADTLTLSVRLCPDVIDEGDGQTYDGEMFHDEESFEVALTWNTTVMTGTDYNIAEVAVATVTITDDDTSVVSVRPRDRFGVIEGQDVIFDVNMSAPNSRAVTVGYFTADLETGDSDTLATAGEDYTGRDTRPDETRPEYIPDELLVIDVGEQRGEIAVKSLTDELDDEKDEYFNLELIDVSAHVLVSDRSGAGRINDGYCINPANNDHPPVRLNIDDDVTVDEAAGTVELVVTTSRRFCDRQSFTYTTGDGTALAGHDYNAADGSATLPAETTEFTLSLPTILINDPIDEANTETFEVEVRWGAELADQNQRYVYNAANPIKATVTISDDDDPPAVVVADARAEEGNDLNFTVSLADPGDHAEAIGSGRETTVKYTTRPTVTRPPTETDPGIRAATEGAEGDTCDVDGVDYRHTTGTLPFPVDPVTGRTDLSLEVPVPSCTDEVPEGIEVFLFELADPSAAWLGQPSTAVGYIVECVDPGSATVTPPDIILRDGGYRVGESEGRVEIVVDLSAPFCVRTEMRVWSEAGSDDGSAVGGGSVGGVGDDYANLVHGTIVFQEKQLTGSIRLHIWDDMIDEEDESFTILADWNAPDSPPLYSGVPPVDSPVTIVDDDTSAVSVQPSFASEGDPVQFTVTMDLENSRDVTVHYYTLDHDPVTAAADPNINPATAGADYDPVAVADETAYVTIRAGQTEAETTIDVATTPSTDPESAETFLLQLRDPTIALLGTPAQTVGTIYDCISVSAAIKYNPRPGVPIPEHLAAPTLTLKFAEGVEGAGPLVVKYETSAPLCEEEGLEKGLSFIWDIDPIQGADVREHLGDEVADEEALDALAAAAEAYHLWYGSRESWYHNVDPRIDPDDGGRLSVVEWQLNGAPQPPVSAFFGDASAVHRGEFDRLGPILPGEISGEIKVPIRPDDIDELDEIFLVEMWWDEQSGAPQWWLAYQERRQGSILLPARIIDDDTSRVSVRDGTGPEGGDVRFRVSLDGDGLEGDGLNSRPVTVSYVVGDDPDATHPATGVGANVDYVARSDTVVIPPGRRWREFTVLAWPDTLNDEPDETFRVTLTGAVSGADHPNPEPVDLGDATAVGTITSCLDLATTTARPQLLINPRPVIESDEVLLVDLVLNTGLCANSAVSLRFVLDMEIGDEAVSVLEDFFGFEHGKYTTVSHADLDELRDPDDIVWIDPGQLSATFEVPVSDDDIDEDDELFGISAFWWGAIRGDGDDFEVVAFDGVPYKGWGTLYDDDDAAVLKLDDSGATVGEGENAVFRVFVDPPRESTHDIVFDFETRDLETGDPETWATAGQDYEPVDSMGTITATSMVEVGGVLRQGVEVPVEIFVDGESEPDERFLFEITEARGADLDADVLGEGLIATCVNPDVATDDVPTLSIVGQNSFEYDGQTAGSAVITVEPSLIVCEDMTITLDYADGTATGRQDGREDLGADYVTLNPSYRDFVLPARARSLEVEVDIVVDWVDEPDETFRVLASWHENSPPAYADQEAVSATVTITDSDDPTYILVEDASGGEGENITFEVSLVHPHGPGDPDFWLRPENRWRSERPISLRYTTRETGTADEGGPCGHPEFGGDFVGVTGSLEFPLDADTGVTAGSATFTVQTCPDNDFGEGDETFSVELELVEPRNARGFETEEFGSSTVAEGTIGSCIDPTLGGQGVPELVLLDPDTPGLAIGEAVYYVGEGDGGGPVGSSTMVPVTVGFGVAFCDDAAVGLSFAVDLEERTAVGTTFGDEDGDFWELDRDSWEMGSEGVHSLEVSWRNAVLIVDDDLGEPDETLTYLIRWDQDVMPPHYWDEWANAPVRIEVEIVDDDTPVVSLAAVGEAKATEGDEVLFRVSMDGKSSRAADVVYGIRGEPGAASPASPSWDLDWDGSDWVTIPAGKMAATFSVRTLTDFVNEGDETFEVYLDRVVWDVAEVNESAKTAVGTILDSPCVNVDDTSTVPEIVVPDWTRVREDAGRPAVPRFSTRRLMTVRFDPPFCEGSRAEIGYYTENGTAVGAAGLPSGLRTYSDTDAVQLVDGAPFVWDFWHTLRRTSSQELPFSAVLQDGGGEVTVPVAVLWDRLDEADEEYTMVLDWHPDMPAHYHEADVTDGRARIVIRDDDPAPVVSVGTGTGVAEGATMTFEVVLDRPSGRPGGDGEATVDWAVTGTGTGVATPGDDFAGETSGTLSFPAGAGGVSPTVETISFDVETDADAAEGPETITVTLSNPQNLRLDTGGGAVAAGAIYDGVACVDPTDSDHVPATLGFASSAVTVIEGDDTHAVFTVTVDPRLCTTATGSLEVRTFNGTAVADPDDHSGDYRELGALDDPGDYAARTVSGAGRNVSVRITDDALDEEVGETFTLQVRWDRDVMPARYHHDPVEATATIIDDDPLPLLVVGDAAGYEGGSLRFAVSLDAPSAREVSVHWQTAAQQGAGDDAATGGVDYESATGTVVFAPGETATTITVDATADTDTEGTETFIVDFSEPHESDDTYNIRVEDATAVGTIHDVPSCVDRDNEDHPPPALIVTNQSRLERNGSLPFRITSAPPMCSGGLVQYRMIPATATTHTYSHTYCGTGTTHADWDWTSTATDWTSGFASGTRQYSATICNDVFDEDDETMIFEVRWATSMGARYQGLPVVRATGTIRDDDDPPSVSLGNATGDEGDPLTFEVTLNTASARTVTVDYATATHETALEHERATFGDDLAHASGTVTIPPGEVTATITIPTIDDDAPEATESFLVHLSNQVNADLATGPVGQGGGATAVGLIRSQEPFPTVRISDTAADEGDTLQFRVSLSAPINEEVIVTGSFVTTGPDKGTATDGDLDGTTLEATYWWSIKPNVIYRIVSVKTKEDFDVEPDETVVLRATSSPNGRAVIDDSVGTGTGTIRNDDVAPVAPLCAGQTKPPDILFSPAPATWWEGSAESSVDVVIWPELCGDATVTVRTESGTGTNRATPGVDFGERGDWDGTLTISPGVDAEAPYWVETADEAEGDECFTIIANWHTDMPAPFQGINDATATIRITEDLTQPATCE